MALLEDIQSRVTPLVAPISEASPSGADVSFAPEFEQLKAEMDKLTALSGGTPNWRDVDTQAVAILTTQAKDLRVAAWLCVARMQMDGYRGFAEGMSVLQGLVDNHWATMWPEAKRARGRANLLTWLVDQCTAFLEQRDVEASDGEAVKLTDDVLSKLDSTLADKLGDAYPGINKLRGMWRNKMRAIPAEAPAAPPPPPPSAAEPQRSAPTPSAPEPASSGPAVAIPSASSGDDPIVTVRECGKTLVELAKMMRRADPAQAVAYRIGRTGTWMGVVQAPPAEEGRTRIPLPPVEIRKRVTAALDNQKWMDLLMAAEDACNAYLFWIDMHRLVAVAMDALGALFMGAREVVGQEVTRFVSRVPTVPNLTFADGTPFCRRGHQGLARERGRRSTAVAGAAAVGAVAAASSGRSARRTPRSRSASKRPGAWCRRSPAKAWRSPTSSPDGRPTRGRASGPASRSRSSPSRVASRTSPGPCSRPWSARPTAEVSRAGSLRSARPSTPACSRACRPRAERTAPLTRSRHGGPSCSTDSAGWIRPPRCGSPAERKPFRFWKK